MTTGPNDTEWKIDRTGWPAGPWDGEPDKLQFRTETGLPGLIVRNRLGGLCGYVGVPKGHPLHGVEYSAGEYPDAPVRRLSAHGGLTYSRACMDPICHVPEPGEPDDVWWFGFDCVHAGDLAPSCLAHGRRNPWREETYRDLAYVRGEVESLARQLAEVAS